MNYAFYYGIVNTSNSNKVELLMSKLKLIYSFADYKEIIKKIYRKIFLQNIIKNEKKFIIKKKILEKDFIVEFYESSTSHEPFIPSTSHESTLEVTNKSSEMSAASHSSMGRLSFEEGSS